MVDSLLSSVSKKVRLLIMCALKIKSSVRTGPDSQGLKIMLDDQNNDKCMTGNDECADCGMKPPEWASYNLGIFLCTRWVIITICLFI